MLQKHERIVVFDFGSCTVIDCQRIENATYTVRLCIYNNGCGLKADPPGIILSGGPAVYAEGAPQMMRTFLRWDSVLGCYGMQL